MMQPTDHLPQGTLPSTTAGFPAPHLRSPFAHGGSSRRRRGIRPAGRGLGGLATLALSAGLLAGFLAACDSSTEPVLERTFLDGVEGDEDIGMILNSTGNALRFFQAGNPEETRVVSFGASSTITPTGIAYRGGRVAVPLGNAGSVALVDAQAMEVSRFFVFAEGNATGGAFVDDETLIVANLSTNQVGRVTLGQSGDAVTQVVSVAPRPTAVVPVGNGRVAVISSNLDENFAPLGPGVVTILDATTLAVVAVVETGDQNPTAGALGPDGRLYVVNTGNFVADGSLAIIAPDSGTLVEVVPGFGPGPGSIDFDAQGRALLSSFSYGTVVWDSRPASRGFVRGPDNPLCAPLTEGGCRGAASARFDTEGSRIYQAFFGSSNQGLPAQVFVYEGLVLTDSIAGGQGAIDVAVTRF
jgi:hypothetical protein